MSVMSFSPEELKKANSKAVMVRVEVKNASQYSGQRKHDLRIGPQPNYVTAERADLNRVVMEPPRPKVLKDACNARREARGAKRAMKSNAGIAAVGIVGFGSDAKKIFEKLTAEAQDAAFIAVGQAVAEEANTRLVGLVVHLDETSIHAHLSFEGYDMDGRPLSDTMKRGMLRRFQDRAAEVMAEHAPGIERGRSRVTRQENGATYAETMHASVAELHERLPFEIAAAQTKLDALSAAIEKNQGHIDKLRAKEELNDKESKRLATYEARLDKKNAEHAEAKSKLDALMKETSETGKALLDQGAKLDAIEQNLGLREAKVQASEKDLEAREFDVKRREGLLDQITEDITARLGAIADRLGVGRGLRQILSVIDRAKAELEEPSPEDPTPQ